MRKEIGILFRPASIGLAWLVLQGQVAVPSPSPSPAPPATYASAEEEISPNYDGESGSSTQLNVRAQLPFDGARYVFRFKFPIVTSAPSSSVTGAGDLALYDLGVIASGQTNWLAGITLRVPTAQNTSLGSGKYSAGPAGGTQIVVGHWTLGFFQQNFFSVIGPKNRSSVGKSQVQPIVSLALPRGWSVGLSTMNATYDWTLNRWTEVPLGLSVDKRFGGVFGINEASVEAEQNLSNLKSTPGWTTRLLVKWRPPPD